MRFALVSLALLGSAWAMPQAVNTRCNNDNCARAVTGTAAGLPRAASRSADCVSYQVATLVPRVTSTQTITGTIPPYATQACSGSPGGVSSAYASACSCLGVRAGSSLSSIPAPAQTPATFKILNRGGPFSLTLLGGGADGQTYGNVNLQVLSPPNAPGAAVPLTFALQGTDLVTVFETQRVGYSFPGEASKVYLSADGAPSFQGMTFTKYVVELGAFDATVPGYLLKFTNAGGQSTGFYQTTGLNYGWGPPGFNEGGPETGGGGPDVPSGQFYAVNI